MKKSVLIFTIAITFLGIQCTAPDQNTEQEPAASEPAEFEPFEEAKVVFEQNATDEDVEVVFEIKGGDSGLSKLKIESPDGRTVVDFSAPDATTLGMRSFRMESPEPKDFPAIKKAYPEGVYTFTGVTTDGQHYKSQSELSHYLPDIITFLNPPAEAEDVSFENLEIKWSPIEGVAGYILELEDEETGAVVGAELPATVNSFSVPAGFLQPEREYKISIASKTEAGNLSFLENSFETAGEEN